jgi:hypothetical protein
MSATDKKNAIAKLEAIEAINREPSFSPEVKEALIDAYMDEDISVEEAQSKTVGFIVGSNSEPNAGDAVADISVRRQTIATIYLSTSLSPTDKHTKIQALLEKGKEEPARENKVGAQGRAVQAIYRDNILTPQEKHERVQALMKGEDYESVKTGSTPLAIAVNPRRPRPSLDYVRMARNPECSESGDSISQLEDQESLFRDEASRGTPPTRSTKASTRASKSLGFGNDREGSSETELKKANSLEEVVIDIDSLSDISDGGKSNRKMYLSVVFSVILFWLIVGPLLYKYWDDISGNSTELTPIRESDATLAPIADPTFSPTESLLYDPYDSPTTTQCVRIGEGNGIYGQDSLLIKTFNLDIDLTLNLGTSNISPMVKTLTEKMQEVLAPALAGCTNESPVVSTQGIRGNGRRKLVREYVVANVMIEAEHQDMESCSPVASGACFRVVAELTLFLKGYETNLQLINHIASVFGKSELVDELQLSAPFLAVEVVNVAASALTTDAPTLAPTIPATALTTSQPTKQPTPWPTMASTMAPTNQPSVSLTIAPTMTRRAHVQQSLRNIDSLNTNAFEWLVNEDYWIPSNWAPPSGEGFWIDRYVLASLYLETGERSWTIRNGWVASTSHCNWYGVSCDSTGRVTAVQLSANNVVGAIPTALNLIQNLQILDLGMNSLSGAIPAELEFMSNIKTLNLQGASLSGFFPGWIGNMASLERLYLNNNDFSGTIPEQIGSLTNINTLSLGTFGVLKSLCISFVSF